MSTFQIVILTILGTIWTQIFAYYLVQWIKRKVAVARFRRKCDNEYRASLENYFGVRRTIDYGTADDYDDNYGRKSAGRFFEVTPLIGCSDPDCVPENPELGEIAHAAMAGDKFPPLLNSESPEFERVTNLINTACNKREKWWRKFNKI
jgi:hypothetical protein